MDEFYKALVGHPDARPPTSNRSGGKEKAQVEGSVSDGSRQGSVSSSSRMEHEGSKAGRKDFQETQMVSIISEGNIPEDGHCWTEYAQMDMSYYRCIHHSQQKCGATKQVQRLDNDMCEVRYLGKHYCTKKLFVTEASVPEYAWDLNLPPPHDPGTPGSPNASVTELDMWRDHSGFCDEGSEVLEAGSDGSKRKQR
ncbi:hypothetical protein RJ639_031105 [Escallonia herrerae]|uniref:WRKY domain-containing protein n=1 Tax=Escallonia herrerae TaxID=1293975 RepID=A0AA88X218_9ASTE|nr:hypothetical protein RJ639_031105 [Escallonia herrerae]